MKNTSRLERIRDLELFGRFNWLVSVIEEYCDQLREVTSSNPDNLMRWPARKNEAARNLKLEIINTLPALAEKFDEDEPDPVYSYHVISFGVDGLENEIATLLWDVFFTWGSSIDDVAKQSRYSLSSVHRHIRAFPRKIALQLWEKNSELANPEKIKIIPTTLKQRRKKLLRDIFNLTDRQAEVLLAFCRHPPLANIGRQVIAEDLVISPNTLKSHCRKIIRKLEAKTMNEAAEKAREVLHETALF